MCSRNVPPHDVYKSPVKLLCQVALSSCNEGDLEEFGEAGFKAFLAYVCQQEHIKLAIAEGELDLNPRLCHYMNKFTMTTLNISARE